MLGRAGGGDCDRLADMELMGVGEGRVSRGEAGPVGSVTVGGEGELRKRIAGLNDDRLCGAPMRGGASRQDELCAWDEPAGIFDGGIGGEEFKPASSAAPMPARKIPKRVAGLVNDQSRRLWPRG